MALKRSTRSKEISFSDINTKLGDSSNDELSFTDTDIVRMLFIDASANPATARSISDGHPCSVMTVATGAYTFAGYKRNQAGSMTDSTISSDSDGGWRFSSSYTATHIIDQLYQQMTNYVLTLYFKVLTTTFSGITSSTNEWTSIDFREARHGVSGHSTHTRAYASFNSYSRIWIWTGGYSDVYGYGLSSNVNAGKVMVRLN